MPHKAGVFKENGNPVAFVKWLESVSGSAIAGKLLPSEGNSALLSSSSNSSYLPTTSLHGHIVHPSSDELLLNPKPK